jgi:HEAT repeat protein
LEDLLSDRDFFIRAEAARALALFGDAQSIPALERQVSREQEGRVIREIREALLALGTIGLDQNRRLSDEVQNLQRKLEEMSARLDRIGPQEPTVTKTGAPLVRKGIVKKKGARKVPNKVSSASRRTPKGARSRDRKR